jgi:hypothetical protein
MKYAVKMGSGASTYLPSFIKIGSGIQKFIVEIHRQHGDLISLLSVFRESRLIICTMVQAGKSPVRLPMR